MEGCGLKTMSHHSRKGHSEENKNPRFKTGFRNRENRNLTQNALFWGGGNGDFRDDHVQGGRIRNLKASKTGPAP